MKPKKVIVKEAKDGNVQKLKNRIRRLEKENKKLKSDLGSYEQAFKKTTKFLKDNTDEISLEELIKAAKENKSLKEITPEEVRQCPKCASDLKKLKYPVGTVIVCENNKCDYRSMEKNE